jgi:hypothetical protein
MTTTICDSSAVDNYLRELSNREAERTRRLNIENYKREVPFTILKYIGIAIAITLVLWALGRSIGNSNSFIQKVIHSGFGGGDISESYSSSSDDQTICIECLLEEKDQDFPLIEEPEFDIVRNYVIFDYVDFQSGDISQVTIGREYPDASSSMSASWCYINVDLDSGAKGTLTLIKNNEDGTRKEPEINQSLADTYGLSIQDLVAAKNKCGI